jgi:hypothetical protein
MLQAILLFEMDGFPPIVYSLMGEFSPKVNRSG